MLILLLSACTPLTGTPISQGTADTEVLVPVEVRVLASEPSEWTVVLEIDWPAGRRGGRPVDAHFSWLALAVHAPDVRMWSLGEVASPGLTEMAEWGGTETLVAELDATGADVWEWRQWTCPEGIVHDNCVESAQFIVVDGGETVFSAATMVGPSPDWFVGADRVSLVDGAFWRDEVVVDLYPLDAGTRDANAWELYGEASVPAQGVSEITAESGQRIGPMQVGRLTLVRR